MPPRLMTVVAVATTIFTVAAARNRRRARHGVDAENAYAESLLDRRVIAEATISYLAQTGMLDEAPRRCLHHRLTEVYIDVGDTFEAAGTRRFERCANTATRRLDTLERTLATLPTPLHQRSSGESP